MIRPRACTGTRAIRRLPTTRWVDRSGTASLKSSEIRSRRHRRVSANNNVVMAAATRHIPRRHVRNGQLQERCSRAPGATAAVLTKEYAGPRSGRHL